MEYGVARSRMRRWLFVVGRHFGDALISRRLLDAIHSSFPEDRIDLFTRRPFAPLFEGRGGVGTLWFSRFPHGTIEPRGFRDLFGFVSKGLGLRRERYDIALNDLGDLRDCIACYLAGARRVAAPTWPAGHPMAELLRLRGARRLINWPLPVSPDTINIYGIMRTLAGQLGCTPSAADGIEISARRAPATQPHAIGLHPFASMECRQWPWALWIDLIQRLLIQGFRVVIFGAPSERSELETRIGSAILSASEVSVVTGELSTFFQGLFGLSAMITLDSFAMHASFQAGIPVIVINGANDHRIWLPPRSRALTNGGGCPLYPCYNRALCVDGSIPRYCCIRDISTESVMKALMEVIADNQDSRLSTV
jgi:heptosyltransferase-3